MIYSTETPYQYARVLQFPSGERWLQLNEGVAVHSVLPSLVAILTGGYWDDFLVLPLASDLGVPRRVAILGDAAGSLRGHMAITSRRRVRMPSSWTVS